MQTNYKLQLTFSENAPLFFAVGVLIGCEHDHHFAVEKDTKSVLCSQLAADCLEEVWGDDRSNISVTHFAETLDLSTE